MITSLTEQRMALQVATKYAAASKRALQHSIQCLKEEEVALTQSLPLASPDIPHPSLLPIEILNRIISFNVPTERPALSGDNVPELQFGLRELHADCTARTVVPRYTMNLYLPMGTVTPKCMDNIAILKSKGVDKLNLWVSGPGSSPFRDFTSWRLADIIEAIANDEAFSGGLRDLRRILSVPDRIGRVDLSLQRPAWALLPVLEVLEPHLAQVEELTMDEMDYDINSVEGLTEAVQEVVRAAAKCEHNSNIRLRRSSLHYSLVKPLADAGLLCSLTHLRVMIWGNYRARTHTPTSIMQGLSGLHSLQVLDLDGDVDVLLPADEMPTHPTIHLPSLQRLFIPHPSFLRAFFKSTQLLQLGLTHKFSQGIGAAFDVIVEKFPALEVLIMVSLQALTISVL